MQMEHNSKTTNKMKKHFLLATSLLFLAHGLFAEEENKSRNLKTAFRSEQFSLQGYGQIEYNLTEHPDGNLPNNSLDLIRAILFATGKLGENKQFGYLIMYDFGPNAKLHELYGEWTPRNAFRIRVGQYKIPFTIENPISPTRIETIRFSRSVAAMSGSNGDVNQWDAAGNSTGAKAGRDAGIQFSGRLFPKNNFYQLEYYAGFFNGTGLNIKDNDNHKDFLATAYYQPIQGLRFGGSVYRGKWLNHPRNRHTVGIEYAGQHFYGRAEYLASTDNLLERDAYYASLVWKIVPDRWEILGKYDSYNSDVDLPNNILSEYTAGINYYFAPLSRIQINYIHSDHSRQGSNNMLLAQLQVSF
jgi:hypothetical protein